jgi:signal transduction histidine kinase
MRSPQSAILAALEHKEFQSVPLVLREGIERNAQRTITLADSFVRLAQAEAVDYAIEPIDLFHLLGDAADALWPTAQAASVEIVVEDPGREYVVEADRSLLARALINLLDNAIKFSPPEKSVVCALRDDVLHGRAAVTCMITDQATGMSQEQQASLFKRFARSSLTGDDVESRPVRSSGIGLGLAVVHTVVTRHDGIIECHSELGGGTVFSITLPLYAGENDEESPPPNS